MQTFRLEKRKTALIIFAALLVGVLVFAIPSAIAYADESSAFLGQIAYELEHIAEDMEEIHHDMHKVVFSMRLISYALIGLVVLKAIDLFAKLVQKKAS